MQADVDKTLRNLGVMAAIKQNDKLITEGEFFTIYTPTTLRALWRMMNRENREQNIQRVTDCMRNARVFITSVLSEYGQNDDRDHWCETVAIKLHRATLLQVCSRVLQALSESLNGLDNLCETYTEDAAMTVKIRQLKQENMDFIESTRKIGGRIEVVSEFHRTNVPETVVPEHP
jgi:hypothetical protein